jgi:hypothetical protein
MNAWSVFDSLIGWTCGPGVLLHRACIKAPTSHADTDRPACYVACLAWASIGRLVVCTVCTFLHVCVRSCMFMDMLDMLSWLCWICWGCLGQDIVVQCAAYTCSCCSHCMVSAHLALVEVGAPNCTCILVHMCWAGLHLAGVLCSSGVLLIWSSTHWTGIATVACFPVITIWLLLTTHRYFVHTVALLVPAFV